MGPPTGTECTGMAKMYVSQRTYGDFSQIRCIYPLEIIQRHVKWHKSINESTHEGMQLVKPNISGFENSMIVPACKT